MKVKTIRAIGVTDWPIIPTFVTIGGFIATVLTTAVHCLYPQYTSDWWPTLSIIVMSFGFIWIRCSDRPTRPF